MAVVNALVFFLIAIGILVLVHEYGHYIVARACGVTVRQFSIGFGPVLWSKRWRNTEWRLSVIPLGGYVKLADEREEPVPAAELPHAFNRKPLWQRNLILVAGAAANFLLAWLAYALIFVIGSDQPRPILAAPMAGTLAEQAQVQDGDEVLKAGEKNIPSWQELRWAVFSAALDKQDLLLMVRNERGEEVPRVLHFSAAPTNKEWGPEFMNHLGLSLHLPSLPPIIGEVLEGPGKIAGLLPGDEVLSVNQQPIKDWRALVMQIGTVAGQPATLEILRGQRRMQLTVTPKVQEGRAVIGVRATPPATTIPFVNVQYNLWDALGQAAQEMYRTLHLSLAMLGKMFVGDVSVRNINGPIAIAQYAGETASTGMLPYMNFLAFVSLSLGMVNLFPIPLLDGGHLLFNLFEWLRGGRPLSERSMVIGQRIGMAVLAALMIIAFYNDIYRLV